MFFKKSKKPVKTIKEITIDRRMKFLNSNDEITYLEELRKKYSGGKIDVADIAEAFRIIYFEANLMAQIPGNGVYKTIKLIAVCGMMVTLNGNVTLPDDVLAYLRSKMPVKKFIDINIARIEKEAK